MIKMEKKRGKQRHGVCRINDDRPPTCTMHTTSIHYQLEFGRRAQFVLFFFFSSFEIDEFSISMTNAINATQTNPPRPIQRLIIIIEQLYYMKSTD